MIICRDNAAPEAISTALSNIRKISPSHAERRHIPGLCNLAALLLLLAVAWPHAAFAMKLETFYVYCSVVGGGDSDRNQHVEFITSIFPAKLPYPSTPADYNRQVYDFNRQVSELTQRFTQWIKGLHPGVLAEGSCSAQFPKDGAERERSNLLRTIEKVNATNSIKIQIKEVDWQAPEPWWP